MKERLNRLIEQGKTFNFRNNCRLSSHGTYSKASDELLAWIANVEDFIKENYGEDSSPFRLYNSFDRTKLSGNYESAFDKQLTTIKGALRSCENIQPKPSKPNEDDNLIIRLIKNPFYWTSIVILISASYALGLKFGRSNFDKEKNEYYEKTKKQDVQIENLIESINVKDSAIKNLNEDISTLNDSIKILTSK
jgi:hypothetical protein